MNNLEYQIYERNGDIHIHLPLCEWHKPLVVFQIE